ncbi:hypothetical protein EVAR_103556_1 [Eumeta japonica]|uniref:Uncharacterized protein n=1 Tax=Eumeta variegata TaxID=151549 RepID=A0A4C1YIU0_EUMVA|nr:hypothetical protein EVAR_103556_1 [Eumeta japonica]
MRFPNLRHRDESWIYLHDPETKQQSTTWVFQDEPNLIKAIRAENTFKQMVVCFLVTRSSYASISLAPQAEFRDLAELGSLLLGLAAGGL